MAEKQIVVLGAGYAGLAAAARAGGRRNRVTLVAPETRFLHRVRQHETAAGHPAQRPTVAQVVRGRGVRHIPARATALDLDARKVMLDTGETIPYDTLVYALGSRTAWHGVPGAAEHAYPAERAAELGARLRAADRPGTVAVVGGGATGIELATEIAEAHPRWTVRIVAAGQVGGWLSARGRRHILDVMARLGVEVHEQSTVTAVDPAGLDTTAGRIPADLVAWAAALEPHPLAAEAGLTVNAAGQAVVDDHLRSVSHPDVHVIGDAAEVTVPGTGTLRMSCATALPMGRYLGGLLAGGADKPFAFRYAVQCLSLGRRDGMVQLIHGDDSMRPTVLTGLTGRLIKALIVNGVVWSLR
ncbi:FAD-dependent oxidoreductase [Kitasatospora sp. RG8]|uniref:NAD(P)/FAD-dependent oxidoreductase n=1 Tax=Kitasatospora sp. RG8 TaxID=2820815 RepID=UPI001AE02DD1|nr:FAD-dependent oxidoreductase [Kitasatospora sp. RG8]MBP0451665.1 FAD-dependent oxidoreductase [Kitasatospora sp. RG8]